MKIKKTFSLLLILALAFGPVAAKAEEPESKVKYVFLFIGDGVSFPQRTAAEYYKANLDSPRHFDDLIGRAKKKISKETGVTTFKPGASRLLMNSLPVQGVSSTYSVNSVITDSAAAATAIATGRKTRHGVLAMSPDLKEKYTSMATMAKAKGRKVGIITSVSLDHATPAAFYANQPSRISYYEIACQIPASGFDFFGGGGFKQLKNTIEAKHVLTVLEEAGYTIARSKSAIEALGQGDLKAVAINQNLDQEKALPYAVDSKAEDLSLAGFVNKGIELLDSPDGFFMMIEGGKIDWACHANDALSAIKDVLALDEAVAVAYGFLQKHPDETLIVVTGDHETGGMAVGFAGTRYDSFLEYLAVQNGSHFAFTKKLDEMKKDGPLTMEKIYPAINEFFGLKLFSESELKWLNKKAASGDLKAIRELAFALQPYEVENLQRALIMSKAKISERSKNDYAFIARFGYYDPLTSMLTQILNNKAGIGWTTFAHSGLPTPVSAAGSGAESFAGYYDNTDIFHKIVEIAGY